MIRSAPILPSWFGFFLLLPTPHDTYDIIWIFCPTTYDCIIIALPSSHLMFCLLDS